MRQEEILSENELSAPKIRNNRTDGINIKACEAVRFFQDKRGEERK
jgi:hypothetical protein